MQEFNPSSEHNLVKESIIKAGKLALKWFKKDPEQWKKDDGTIVSKADIEINDLLNNPVDYLIVFKSHYFVQIKENLIKLGFNSNAIIDINNI